MRQKVKVLFILTTMERGGPTNVVYNIIKNLDREIIEPIILTLSPEPLKSRKGDFESLGIQLYSFGAGRLRWLMGNLSSLIALVHKIGPDVLHTHSYRPDVLSSNHLVEYPRITTLHGDLYTNYKNTYNRFIALLLSRRQINAAKLVERVVACSNSVHNLYKDQVPNIQLIPNGVDDQIFYPATKEQVSKLREALDIPSDKLIFISVGSLCERKDPRTLIDGFIGSKVKHKALLYLLGDGPLFKSLQHRYHEYENVVFRGFTDRVFDYMKCADFFVSASHSEGLPNTVLEALACGLPVCLSNIDSHREILNKNQNAGTSFEVQDVSGLSRGIDSLAQLPDETQRDHARRIIVEHYSARQMAQKYQRLYLETASNKG